MENEVIIDGCNVAECPFYQYQTPDDYKMKYPESGDCEIGMAGYLFDYDRINEELEKACLSNHNCHFKQLQRKAKECENVIHNWQFSEKLYSKLKSENEWLKEIADKALNDKNKWLDKYNILLSENEKLKLMLSEKYGVYK